MRFPATIRIALTLAILVAAIGSGCGYHTVGSAHGLPPDVKILAVPIFINQTHSYHVETVLTEAVIREFNTRTRFRVVHSADDADAVVRGTVLSVQSAPVAYDSKTGRASTGLVTITAKVSLTARDGRILYSNSNLVFRDQYQISNELASFFEEQGPAQDRLARDFARTLVSNLLEAF